MCSRFSHRFAKGAAYDKLNTMTKEEFDNTLREFWWAEPPRPFVVELTNGSRIDVDDPKAVAFNEGSGVFLSPAYELIGFSYDKVLKIYAAQEAIP